MEVSTQAIVLKRYDYSESSQIAHVFSVEDGRLSMLAKGAKRPQAALKGPIDLFFRAHVRYRKRAGSDLCLLTRYEPITGYPKLRGQLERLLAAFYLVELAHDGTRELDPSPEIFQLLVESLQALETAPVGALASVVLATELAFLDASGVKPQFESCARCGRPAPAGPLMLHPFDGGVLCESCREPRMPRRRLDAGTGRVLQHLARQSPSTAIGLRPTAVQEAALRDLLDEMVSGFLDRPLRSARFLRKRRSAASRTAGGVPVR